MSQSSAEHSEELVTETQRIRQLGLPDLCKLPERLPPDRDLPTRHNTFSHPAQMEMSEAFREYGSIEVLLSVIRNVERKTAPDPTLSTLLQENKAADITALLYSLPRDRLGALLDNTYVPTAIRNGWHVIERDFQATYTDREQPFGTVWTPDPGIHLDYVSPRSGLPLSRDQFLLLAQGVHILSGAAPPEIHEQFASRVADDSGLGLLKRVQETWYNMNAKLGKKFVAWTIEEEAKIERSPSALPSGHYRTDYDTKRFKELILREVDRNELSRWALTWYDIINNTQGDITYFPIPTKIGRSMFLCAGLRSTMEYSFQINLFTVIHVTAAALFPELEIVLYQVVLFRLFEPHQVSIADSMAHTINMAYLSTGGFAAYQAQVNPSMASMDDKHSRDYWFKRPNYLKRGESDIIISENRVVEKQRSIELRTRFEQRRELIERLRAEAATSHPVQLSAIMEEWTMLEAAIKRAESIVL